MGKETDETSCEVQMQFLWSEVLHDQAAIQTREGLHEMIGTPEDYFIKPGYVVRPDNRFFDDTPFKDEFQDGVYRFARGLSYSYQKICDIGCGSGFKLLKYFKRYQTLGIDLEPTVSWLKAQYPDRSWQEASAEPIQGYDLAICADVIEHIPDPNELLDFLSRCDFKRIVISTPDRTKMPSGFDGPPGNPHHVREWDVPEFNAYLSSRFQVVKHFVDGPTQIAEICR